MYQISEATEHKGDPGTKLGHREKDSMITEILCVVIKEPQRMLKSNTSLHITYANTAFLGDNDLNNQDAFV